MAEETTPQPEAKPMDMEAMKQMLHDYQVPMSEETLKGIAGEGPVEPSKASAFENYVKTAAQGLYPTFAPQIKAGIPTAYLLDPYRQVAKQVLGEQFEPDFMGNSQHAKALSGNIDPATGRPAPMSLDQWRSHLKSEPSFGWANTPDGIDAHRSVLRVIHQAFNQGGQ